MNKDLAIDYLTQTFRKMHHSTTDAELKSSISNVLDIYVEDVLEEHYLRIKTTVFNNHTHNSYRNKMLNLITGALLTASPKEQEQYGYTITSHAHSQLRLHSREEQAYVLDTAVIDQGFRYVRNKSNINGLSTDHQRIIIKADLFDNYGYLTFPTMVALMKIGLLGA